MSETQHTPRDLGHVVDDNAPPKTQGGVLKFARSLSIQFEGQPVTVTACGHCRRACPHCLAKIQPDDAQKQLREADAKDVTILAAFCRSVPDCRTT